MLEIHRGLLIFLFCYPPSVWRAGNGKEHQQTAAHCQHKNNGTICGELRHEGKVLFIWTPHSLRSPLINNAWISHISWRDPTLHINPQISNPSMPLKKPHWMKTKKRPTTKTHSKHKDKHKRSLWVLRGSFKNQQCITPSTERIARHLILEQLHPTMEWSRTSPVRQPSAAERISLWDYQLSERIWHDKTE